MPNQYSSEVLALRDRVILGNKKLNDAWEQIQQLVGDKEEWERQMDRWRQAQEKLHSLCEELKAKGYQDALLSAELVAQRTRELLSTRGWCLWKCESLGGDVIAVVRDESVKGVPEGYPVYTEAELEKLFRRDISKATLRLVHEAKKIGEAIIMVENGGQDGKVQ